MYSELCCIYMCMSQIQPDYRIELEIVWTSTGYELNLYSDQKNFANVKHKCWLLGHRVSRNTRERNTPPNAHLTHAYLQHTGRPSNKHLCFAVPKFFWLNWASKTLKTMRMCQQ